MEWSATEIAELLDLTVASVNSALQRAFAMLRARMTPGRQDWLPSTPATEEQRAVLKRFMDAWEQGDADALTTLLREDARWSMPPAALWFDGRDAIASMLRLYPPRWQGREFRMLPTGANRQPAAASYLRMPGESAHRFTGVHVLRVEAGQIVEITTFSAALCSRFQVPASL